VLAGAGGAGSAKPLAYHVVAASATAQLVYNGVSANEVQRTSGTVSVTSRKAGGKLAKKNGSLTRSGGRIVVLLVVKRSERALIKERPGPAQPYVEQKCVNSRSLSASGGVVLKRLRANRVEIRWAFPHAGVSYCPGPAGIAKRLVSKMSRSYPAARLNARRFTLSLSGSTPFQQGAYSGTYRWRATLVLVRV
jgi:hypothetical protein